MFLLYRCKNNSYIFSGNGQGLSNNWIIGLPCVVSRSNKNIDGSNLKRRLLYEFRMKELNERLEQITMFNTRYQIKKC